MIRKMTTLLTGVFCLGLLLNATPAQAGSRHETRKDRRELSDDKRDFRAIVTITESWKKARRNKNQRAEKAADQRLVRWLQREIKESKREAHDANREARRNRHSRDDRNDAREKRHDAYKTQKIAKQLMAIQGQFMAGTATAKHYSRKRALLNKLVRMASEEVRESKEELREDQRERRRKNKRRRRRMIKVR